METIDRSSFQSIIESLKPLHLNSKAKLFNILADINPHGDEIVYDKMRELQSYYQELALCLQCKHKELYGFKLRIDYPTITQRIQSSLHNLSISQYVSFVSELIASINKDVLPLSDRDNIGYIEHIIQELQELFGSP